MCGRKKGKGNLSFENSSFLPKTQKLFRRHEPDYEVLVRLCKNDEAPTLSGGVATLVFIRRKQDAKRLLDKAPSHLASVRVRPKATLVRHKRPTQSFVRLSALADRVATRLRWDALFIGCR